MDLIKSPCASTTNSHLFYRNLSDELTVLYHTLDALRSLDVLCLGDHAELLSGLTPLRPALEILVQLRQIVRDTMGRSRWNEGPGARHGRAPSIRSMSADRDCPRRILLVGFGRKRVVDRDL